MSDDQIQMDERVADFIVDLQEQLAKAESERDELAKRLGDDAPVEDDSPESIFKALDEEDPIRKAWEADRVEIEKQRAEKETLEAEALAKSFVEKAGDYTEILGKAEDSGPVLQELAAAAPEAYATLEGLLDVAKEQVNTSGLFEEIGKAGAPAGGGDAYEQASQIAKGIAQSEDLSPAEAMAKAWEQNPDLYAEYEADKRSTTLR
jgi:cobalamin biosynthesis Mg chelatase CobN